MWGKHSHTAVRFLLKAFVGRHAQRHLTYLTAETTFVPILERREQEMWRALSQNELSIYEMKTSCSVRLSSLEKEQTRHQCKLQ